MIQGMHEFYGATIFRGDVQTEIGRELTDEEWNNLINHIGSEIDRVDAQVIDNAIAELRGDN